MANETGKGFDYFHILGSNRRFGMEYFNVDYPDPGNPETSGH